MKKTESEGTSAVLTNIHPEHWLQIGPKEDFWIYSHALHASPQWDIETGLRPHWWVRLVRWPMNHQVDKAHPFSAKGPSIFRQVLCQAMASPPISGSPVARSVKAIRPKRAKSMHFHGNGLLHGTFF